MDEVPQSGQGQPPTPPPALSVPPSPDYEQGETNIKLPKRRGKLIALILVLILLALIIAGVLWYMLQQRQVEVLMEEEQTVPAAEPLLLPEASPVADEAEATLTPGDTVGEIETDLNTLNLDTADEEFSDIDSEIEGL